VSGRDGACEPADWRRPPSSKVPAQKAQSDKIAAKCRGGRSNRLLSSLRAGSMNQTSGTPIFNSPRPPAPGRSAAGPARAFAGPANHLFDSGRGPGFKSDLHPQNCLAPSPNTTMTIKADTNHISLSNLIAASESGVDFGGRRRLETAPSRPAARSMLSVNLGAGAASCRLSARFHSSDCSR
jgi:hypothetical protein